MHRNSVQLITLKACNVKLRRNEPTRINLEFDMPTVLDQMYARFTLNYKLKTYQPLLIDVTMEVCWALNQKPGVNPMADYVLGTIREHIVKIVLAESVLQLFGRITDKNNVTMINARGYLAVRSKGLAALSMLDW
ncbi:hypothetical protein pipiens_017666 [Culex pipiens pipiens]|uniref:Uncharacterized protein n=1 Tax=Culex pipiens pipiens TaxID=38569 RepID=A0ABD1CFN8_CULPP